MCLHVTVYDGINALYYVLPCYFLHMEAVFDFLQIFDALRLIDWDAAFRTYPLQPEPAGAYNYDIHYFHIGLTWSAAFKAKKLIHCAFVLFLAAR